MKLPVDSRQPADYSSLSRRRVLKAAGASGMAAIAGAVTGTGLAAEAARGPETLVQSFFTSLSQEQMSAVVFPFNHEERLRVENNWHITKQTVGGFFNADQQAMVREIFDGLHAEPYREQVRQQFIHDNTTKRNSTPEQAFGSASVALFGTPGTGNFEFVFTGRHCTRRCDGDSVEGAAFGGPIFYGHQAGAEFDEAADHPGNVYWFQAKRAKEVFAMLDGKQREAALQDKPRRERGTKTVELSGKVEGLEGLAVSDMSDDQKGEVREVLSDLLAPFREADREESMRLIEPQFDQLRMAFYKAHDVGGDGVWDTWQIEGPSMIWHFRGDPHVHTWVNIREPKPAVG